MTNRRRNTLLAAAGFCASGLILLLFNFNLFERYEPAAQYLGGALILVASMGSFLGYAASRRSPQPEWWRLIPSWILLALAAILVLSTVPGLDPRFNAALLFGGLAAAFIHIFLLKTDEFWWAIIPGGFMLVLGIVIALSSTINRIETLGALLFSGMGLVFFALYLLGDRRQWWALMPGSILLLFGFFVLTWEQNGTESSGAILRWWPLILIVIGVLLALRSNRQRPTDKIETHAAPSRRREERSQKPRVSTLPTAKPPQRLTGSGQSSSTSAPGTSIEILPDND